MNNINFKQCIGASLLSGLIASILINGSPVAGGESHFILTWLGWSIFSLSLTYPFWYKKK